MLVDLLPKVFQPFTTCHSFICSCTHSTTLSEHGDDLPWKNSHATGDRPRDHCSSPPLSSSSWGQIPAQDNQGVSDAAQGSPHIHRTRFHPQKHLWGAHSPKWWVLPAIATAPLGAHHSPIRTHEVPVRVVITHTTEGMRAMRVILGLPA